jgi:hypothetical protein
LVELLDEKGILGKEEVVERMKKLRAEAAARQRPQ